MINDNSGNKDTKKPRKLGGKEKKQKRREQKRRKDRG